MQHRFYALNEHIHESKRIGENMHVATIPKSHLYVHSHSHFMYTSYIILFLF